MTAVILQAARSYVRDFRRAAAERAQLLNLPDASNQRNSDQTVFFLTPDHDRPAGGIRVIYRHVDLLNEAGIKAAVLHQSPGFRCTWFEHETVVRDVRHTQVNRRDLLVVGERNVGSFGPGEVPYDHVVFNQNSFDTWSGHPELVDRYYRLGPRPKVILTVSEYARAHLALAFPNIPVVRLHLSIGPAFFYRDSARDRIITYMPRKGAQDQALLLRKSMRGFDLAAGWRFEPLDRLLHEEVARRLQSSQIFLSFAESEGFGLPAAEAMACGNYVVGSHGFGGREYFDSRYCSTVEPGDALGMALALRDVLIRAQQDPHWLDDARRKAAAHVAQEYSNEAERRDVVEAYSQLLGSSSPIEAP